MNTFLHDKIPLLISINFFIFLFLFYINWKYIRKFILKIDGTTGFAIFVIFVLALLIRLFVPSVQHIMYIDEAWYMEAAKNILQQGHQGVYPKSIGWPFILSLFFRVFGVNNWVALYTSVVLGSLTAVSVFFLTFVITQRKDVSLFSSLLIALYPVHIRWSGSAETNVASLFFVSLTIFLNFIYYREKKDKLLWLSLASVALTAQFRPENYTLWILFLVGCLLFDRERIKQVSEKYFLPWMVFGILCLPNLVQTVNTYTSTNFIESGSHGRLSGSNWSLLNLIHNSLRYGIYLFNSELQPGFLLFFVLLGSIFMFFRQKKEWAFLLTWFFFLWLVYFSSWFQTLGGNSNILAKSRLLISFYPIFSIFASCGVMGLIDAFFSKTQNLSFKRGFSWGVSLLIILMFIPYRKLSSHMFSDNAHLLETKIPELAEKDIPAHCMIVANWPTILKSTTGLNVTDARVFLEDSRYQERIFNEKECVLFFEDLTCSLWKSEGEVCKRMKSNFFMKEFQSYSEGNEKYFFYKISKK